MTVLPSSPGNSNIFVLEHLIVFDGRGPDYSTRINPGTDPLNAWSLRTLG